MSLPLLLAGRLTPPPAIPTVADALDRRARRNAGIDLMDQAQRFDFARDSIAGRESSAWDEEERAG